jgi:hypothetical protein
MIWAMTGSSGAIMVLRGAIKGQQSGTISLPGNSVASVGLQSVFDTPSSPSDQVALPPNPIEPNPLAHDLCG